jgi:hypothetical protein
MGYILHRVKCSFFEFAVDVNGGSPAVRGRSIPLKLYGVIPLSSKQPATTIGSQNGANPRAPLRSI